MTVNALPSGRGRWANRGAPRAREPAKGRGHDGRDWLSGARRASRGRDETGAPLARGRGCRGRGGGGSRWSRRVPTRPRPASLPGSGRLCGALGAADPRGWSVRAGAGGAERRHDGLAPTLDVPVRGSRRCVRRARPRVGVAPARRVSPRSAFDPADVWAVGLRVGCRGRDGAGRAAASGCVSIRVEAGRTGAPLARASELTGRGPGRRGARRHRA